MARRLVISGTALALALGGVLATTAGAASLPVSAHGGICRINGWATISPGLTTTAQAEQVTLSDVTLTACKSGTTAKPGAPTSLTGTVVTSPNPLSSMASCASGNLALDATISWSDGSTADTTVTTTGIAATQTLTGKVVSTTSSFLAPGDTVGGEVAFTPTTTAQNCVKVPVTAVMFTGVLGAGS
jgi:hypothetical protein